MLLAPVKNENSDVILFIINLEELSENIENKFSQGNIYLEIFDFFF
jgi:hypothetical protein